MKKFQAGLFFLAFLFCFSGCRSNSAAADELQKLGLEPCCGTATLRILSQDGFHGHDLLKLNVACKDDLQGTLQKDSRWKAYPMDDRTRKWMEEELSGISDSASRITHGFYFLTSHTGGDPIKGLESGDCDFIMALYDSDHHTLYYCEAGI